MQAKGQQHIGIINILLVILMCLLVVMQTYLKFKITGTILNTKTPKNVNSGNCR
jgi:hypothetical protein